MRRLILALGYSLKGLRYAFASQQAFRLDVLLFVCFSPLVFYLTGDAVRRAMLIGSLFLILLAELANTAIETTIDRISTESHPLSGHAKDIGSALVLLALLNALVIWALLLL